MNYFIYREDSLSAAKVAVSVVTTTRIAACYILSRSAWGNVRKIATRNLLLTGVTTDNF